MVMVGMASSIGCGRSCLSLFHHLEVGCQLLVTHVHHVLEGGEESTIRQTNKRFTSLLVMNKGIGKFPIYGSLHLSNHAHHISY